MHKNMKKEEVVYEALLLLFHNSTDQSFFSVELCFLITCFAVFGLSSLSCEIKFLFPYLEDDTQVIALLSICT